MVIGIDSSQANRKIRSGTEWYAFYLIREFKKLLAGHSDIKVRLYLRDKPLPDLAKNLPQNFECRILHWPFKYFWGQIRLSWEMLIHPPDILFCPAHTIPLIRPGTELPLPLFSKEGRERGVQGRTFTTLHDVGFEDYPELYDPLSRWYHRWSARRAVKKAYHIFTVSEFSKERIVENYHNSSQPPLTLRGGAPSLILREGGGELRNRITVTHLGVNNDMSIDIQLFSLKKYNLTVKNYLLYIGRLEPKKNILNMIRAYEMAELDMPLVLAGKRVNIRDVEDYLDRHPELRERIKFLDYVPEADKAALYKGAAMFLFLTLYEGFGLPILEAQAAGLPVITSNTASNAEIAGQGAVIVDPESPYEIAQAIKRLLSDDALKSDKIRLGYENVKRFSWEECARKTLEKLLDSSVIARSGATKQSQQQ